jgi:hypothetical protein
VIIPKKKNSKVSTLDILKTLDVQINIYYSLAQRKVIREWSAKDKTWADIFNLRIIGQTKKMLKGTSKFINAKWEGETIFREAAHEIKYFPQMISKKYEYHLLLSLKII